MQGAIDSLHSFCSVSGLSVNTDKTRVMVFSAVKKLPRGDLLLNGTPLKVVENYTYLGVVFSCNGKFAAQVEAVKRKVLLAAAQVRPVLAQLSCLAQSCEHSLFEAKICSTLLYAADVWSVWHLQGVEQIQLQYYKRLFLLHFSTPGYVLRHLLNICPQSCRILQLCLNWHSRVLRMDPDRWPRKCLDRLVYRASQSANSEYNWVAKIEELLVPYGLSFPPSLPVKEVASAVWIRNKAQDSERAIASSYCPIFGQLVAAGTIAIPPTLNLREMRLAFQVVAQNGLFQSLFWCGAAEKFAPLSSCPCCSLGLPDTIEHMVAVCPAYGDLRLRTGLSVHRSLADMVRAENGLVHIVSFLKSAWRRCDGIRSGRLSHPYSLSLPTATPFLSPLN